MVVYLYMNGFRYYRWLSSFMGTKPMMPIGQLNCINVVGNSSYPNSILNWAFGASCSSPFVDDVDKDPILAKRGFWFSHIGWML